MHDPSCTVIFDAALQPALDWFGIVSVVMGLTGLAVSAYHLLTKRLIKRWLWVSFCCLLLLIGPWRAWRAHSHAAQAARARDYVWVSGTVEDLQTTPCSESFRVGDTHFTYVERDKSHGGFNHTVASRGPIREGLFVKIGHRDRVILHLEACEPQEPSGSAEQR